MIYQRMRRAIFLNRPNRFIAHILLDGEEVVCHVKNTGRCRELLIPGAHILVQEAASAQRKTAYDLIAVWKGPRLVNMDANAPNRVFGEWLLSGGLGGVPTVVQPERVFGDSRFDFYFELAGQPCFAEVKGVTLEQDDIALFPDAPTERGVKHLRGLAESVSQGYVAYAVFVIQMCNVKYFAPNWATHAAFGQALVQARSAGVHVLALDCRVGEDSLVIRRPVEARLDVLLFIS